MNTEQTSKNIFRYIYIYIYIYINIYKISNILKLPDYIALYKTQY